MPFEEGLGSLVVFDFQQVLLQLRVGVRVVVREENLVVVVLKLVGELQRVVNFLRVEFGQVVSEVGNLIAAAMPADALFIGLLFRVDADFHPFVEQRVVFGEVNYVEFYFRVFSPVLNFEKKPLRESCCVDVVLEN